MEMTREDGYMISTDQQRLDIDYIHWWLSERSYWAKGRSRATVEKTIANSLCFGLYAGAKQIGFGRVITDFTLFGWLCDVFVDEAQQKRGLGKWLVQTVFAHPDLAPVKSWMLATRDAHELYRRFGFETISTPDNFMRRMHDE